MDSTRQPISPPTTLLNSANAPSSQATSENKKIWTPITNLLKKILCDIQLYAELLLGDSFDDPKMSVMFGVEYMSQGMLRGAHQKKSLKIAQQQLKKLCEDNPQNIEFKKALDEITFAHSIEQTRSNTSKRSNEPCAKKIIEKMTSLKEKEGIFIPAYYLTKRRGHAMMARIVCTEASSPRKYTFSIYNEGAGLEFHDQSTNNLDNSRLSWENVPEDNLTQDFFTAFLNQGIPDKDHSIQVFYDLLKSRFKEPSQAKTDSKNLTTGQRGGSCAAQSVLSALRDILTKEEYQALKSQLRHDYLYKIYRTIKLGDPDPLLPLITLELIHKIEKNKDKDGSFSKFSDLDQIKKEMEKKIAAQSDLKAKDKTNSKKQIAAFFKGNSDIVSEMTKETLKTVIKQMETTPCTKKQFEAIQKKAQKYNDIDLDDIREIFTKSKSTVQVQNILSDQNAIKKLDENTMSDLLRRITSQEITCKYSEFYNIKARAEELGIQIPEELEERFPKLDTEGMIAQWETDNDLENYMDITTVGEAMLKYMKNGKIPSSLLIRYEELFKSNNK